jgi:hypothetical protein
LFSDALLKLLPCANDDYRKTTDLEANDAPHHRFGEHVSHHIYGEASSPQVAMYAVSSENDSSSSSPSSTDGKDHPDKKRHSGDAITSTYSTSGHYEPLPTYSAPASRHYSVLASIAGGEHVLSFETSSEIFPSNDTTCNQPPESVAHYS